MVISWECVGSETRVRDLGVHSDTKVTFNDSINYNVYLRGFMKRNCFDNHNAYAIIIMV